MTRRIALHAGLCLLLLACTPPASVRPAADTSVATLYAEHYHDGVYFNPWAPFEVSWMNLLRAYLQPNPHDRSRPPQVAQQELNPELLAQPVTTPTLSWLGHATVAIQAGDDLLLTDPHLSDGVPLYARKTPPAVALAQLPDPRLAVISHNHYDHLDEDTVMGLSAGVHWLVPKGLAAWFEARGRKVSELDWWQSVSDGPWTLTCVPMQHWSRRWGQAKNETLWCGWLIEGHGSRYFFAGDSGYFHGFAEIGRQLGPIDVALLPIGAYAPRWFLGYQHMAPEEALQAFVDLRARYLLPVHWGAFDFAQEPLDEPPRALMRAAEAAGLGAAVKVFPVGGRFELPPGGE